MTEEFCIFFDVLGTTSYFKGIKNGEEIKLLDRYERLMEIIKYEAKKINISKSKIKYFSDNIFVSTPKNKLKELYNLLDFISICQIRSITECNLSIRGGVAFDTIRNKDNILMGKGLIKAHDEETKAVYPWIKFNKETIKIYDKLLSEKRKEKVSKVKGATRENVEKVKEELTKEENWDLFRILKIRKGAFLNYLNIIKDNQNLLGILEKHKNFIVANLKNDLKKIDEEDLDFLKLKDGLINMGFKFIAYNMLLKAEVKEENIVNINIAINEIRKEIKKQINALNQSLKSKDTIQNIMKIRKKYLFLAFYHNAMVEHFILEKKLRKEDRENKIDYSKLYN